MERKQERTHKYEDDLYYYVKLKKKNKERFKTFPTLYDLFIQKNVFSCDELKTKRLNFKYTHEFETYVKDDFKDLSYMLDTFDTFGILNITYVKNIIISYLTAYKRPWINVSKINSKFELIKLLLATMNQSDITIKAIYEIAIKTYVLIEGENIKKKMAFIENSCEDFNEYFNLIVNKKIIPDDLINKISWLMMMPEFKIPSGLNDDQNMTIKLLEYTHEFANYTHFHNLTVKKNKELQAIKEFEKANNNFKESLDFNKDEVVSEVKSVTSEKPIIFESDDALLNNEEVDNMVKSFLPGICADDRSSVEDDMLPSKYDPNYNDIIIGLFNAYEAYTTNKRPSTMADFNKYNDLAFMVDEIKRKS